MKSNTLKLCLVLIALNIVALGCFVAFMYFIKTKVQSVAAYEAGAQEQSSYVEANHSLQALLHDIEPDMTKLTSRAVVSDDAVGFIEYVESLAKQNGLLVTVHAITTEDIKEQPGYQWMDINFSTDGSWAGQYQFILLLQTLPYKTNLMSLNLNHDVDASLSDTTKKQVVSAQSTWASAITLQVLEKK